MDHVIDALAADVIITRTQTINRAWNFESLENMVLECSAIDWLKGFTRLGVLNTVARCLVEWKGKAKKPTLRADQPTWTISAIGYKNEGLKKQTNCNYVIIHNTLNKYLINALHQAGINNEFELRINVTLL